MFNCVNQHVARLYRSPIRAPVIPSLSSKHDDMFCRNSQSVSSFQTSDGDQGARLRGGVQGGGGEDQVEDEGVGVGGSDGGAGGAGGGTDQWGDKT